MDPRRRGRRFPWTYYFLPRIVIPYNYWQRSQYGPSSADLSDVVARLDRLSRHPLTGHAAEMLNSTRLDPQRAWTSHTRSTRMTHTALSWTASVSDHDGIFASPGSVN